MRSLVARSLIDCSGSCVGVPAMHAHENIKRSGLPKIQSAPINRMACDGKQRQGWPCPIEATARGGGAIGDDDGSDARRDDYFVESVDRSRLEGVEKRHGPRRPIMQLTDNRRCCWIVQPTRPPPRSRRGRQWAGRSHSIESGQQKKRESSGAVGSAGAVDDDWAAGRRPACCSRRLARSRQRRVSDRYAGGFDLCPLLVPSQSLNRTPPTHPHPTQ